MDPELPGCSGIWLPGDATSSWTGSYCPRFCVPCFQRARRRRASFQLLPWVFPLASSSSLGWKPRGSPPVGESPSPKTHRQAGKCLSKVHPSKVLRMTQLKPLHEKKHFSDVTRFVSGDPRTQFSRKFAESFLCAGSATSKGFGEGTTPTIFPQAKPVDNSATGSKACTPKSSQPPKHFP